MLYRDVYSIVGQLAYFDTYQQKSRTPREYIMSKSTPIRIISQLIGQWSRPLLSLLFCLPLVVLSENSCWPFHVIKYDHVGLLKYCP